MFSYSTVRSTFVYVQIGLLLPFIHALFTYEETMDEKNLPYPGWDFFEITSPQVFWATYFYQVIAGVFGDAFQIAHDSMFCGLTSLTCAQADLIKHRLINLPKLKKEMRYKQLVLIVCQHVATKRYNEKYILIYFNGWVKLSNWEMKHIILKIVYCRLISQMQEIFGLLITWQFCSLTVNSSMNIYSFTAAQNVDQISSLDLITLVAYLAIVTEIIFFYCWFGNELIVQVSKWYSMQISETSLLRNQWDLLYIFLSLLIDIFDSWSYNSNELDWIGQRMCSEHNDHSGTGHKTSKTHHWNNCWFVPRHLSEGKLIEKYKSDEINIWVGNMEFLIVQRCFLHLQFCKMTYGTYNMLRTITNKGK